MSTTIRIEDDDKSRLRDIQQKWRGAVGEHASQQEILSKALAYLLRHWDDFVHESSWRPLTKAEIRSLHKRVAMDLGEPLSDRVDELLYGLKR